MVEGQIRTNKVTDERLLAALSATPRHLFVPAALAGVAYVDTCLRVAPDRYLMEPLFLARLLQEAEAEATDSALIVGAGTGYSAAILSGLVASVVALESDGDLAARARSNLDMLGTRDVTVETGALDQGFAASGPYDVILVDGMVDFVPESLFGQLKEHGRLVTLVSSEGRCGAGMLYRKLGGSISGRVLFDASAPLLPGFAHQPAFEF
jgi:protein-L-isoaspartate(D-aspartate) O-methyltransferase